MIAEIKLLRGHVKGGIEYLHAFGRQRFAEHMRHFFGVALLDRNILARRAIKSMEEVGPAT